MPLTVYSSAKLMTNTVYETVHFTVIGHNRIAAQNRQKQCSDAHINFYSQLDSHLSSACLSPLYSILDLIYNNNGRQIPMTTQTIWAIHMIIDGVFIYTQKMQLKHLDHAVCSKLIGSRVGYTKGIPPQMCNVSRIICVHFIRRVCRQ